MSKIFAELAAATGLKKLDPKNEGDLKKLILAVGKELSDKEWAALSGPAQDWYNEAADAVNDKKDIPAFPDAEEEQEQAPPARRRAAPAEEPKQQAVGGPDILAVGQTVVVKTKRDKTYEGEVTKLDTKDGFVEIGGKDGDEVDLDKIATVTVLKAAAKNDEPDAGSAEPAVGDTVKLTNKRGKVFEGTITELTDEEVVIETADGPEDFVLEKVGSIEVLKKAKAEKASSRRSSSKDDEGEKGGKGKDKDGDEKPKRSSNPAGVSVGARIREFMCEDLAISEEAVGKALDKEGLEYRPATLKMIYKDTKATIDLLIENKHMKAPK